MKPRFAVVGHTNEGKSSVVSTLVENDAIRIGEEAGTTTSSREYSLTVDGVTLFGVFDTPGFEQAPAVLEWLNQERVPASDRPGRVRAFVEEFRGKERFREEVELLTPILDGAVILYVVDGSHPYRPVFEDELEILRWTGAPSVGLVNRTRERDHVQEWLSALGQYFNVVREFDAHRIRFVERLELLKDLCSLDPRIRDVLSVAVKTLEEDHERRLDDAAGLIAARSVDMVSYRMVVPGSVDSLSTAARRKAEAEYHDKLREMEERARKNLAEIFKHKRLSYRQDELALTGLDQDLFADGTFRVFGLSAKSLVAAGGVSGALAGGALDAAVAGHSFMLGALIGGAVGAGGTFLKIATDPLAKGSFSGEAYRVGPHPSQKFGSVVLDRMVVFSRELLSRTHARRDEMAARGATMADAEGVLDGLDFGPKKTVFRVFEKARKKSASDKEVSELAKVVRGLLVSR